jgi:hypothetical protein
MSFKKGDRVLFRERDKGTVEYIGGDGEVWCVYDGNTMAQHCPPECLTLIKKAISVPKRNLPEWF